MRVVWTELALFDLRDVRDYVGWHDKRAAAAQIERVTDAVANLTHFPALGRQGRRPETRELVVGQTHFIVAYRLREGTIEILRVLHARQRWPIRLDE